MNISKEKVAALHARVVARSTPAPGGCLLYGGKINRGGYGVIGFRDSDGKLRAVRAHRLAYTVAKGEIPPGLLIRHTCDVRNCVAPDHLLTGTKADNSQDMLSRSRHPDHMRPSPACRACGADKWRLRPNGSRYCLPCHNRLCTEGARRRRQARQVAT